MKKVIGIEIKKGGIELKNTEYKYYKLISIPIFLCTFIIYFFRVLKTLKSITTKPTYLYSSPNQSYNFSILHSYFH